MDLKKIETGIKRLVESQLVRAVLGSKPEDRVLQRLMEELRAGTRTDQAGRRVAPNAFAIMVPPGASALWMQHLSLPVLRDAVREMADQSGARLMASPTIDVIEDRKEVPDGSFRVIATFDQAPVKETQEVVSHTPRLEPSPEGDAAPANAVLIVDGAAQYALSRAVVNVGRRLDNNLVIEDPRVSRHHAQLRAIDGHFVLFDLNSSGGCFVNGKRTTQTVLRPGDVISLAGFTLIYTQEPSIAEQHPAATAPHRVGGERPTVVRESRPSEEEDRGKP
jgi:hypothetical protein